MTKKIKKLTKDEVKKIKKEIQNSKKKLNSYHLKNEKFLSSSTKFAWSMGKRLNKLKKLNKKLGEIKWEKYLYNNFRYIHEKKAQRYMRLARCINMKKFPALTLIPLCDLDLLILQCKEAKESANGVLKEFMNSGDFKEVPDDVERICDFKKLFKDMTRRLKPTSVDWRDVDFGHSNYEIQIKEDRKLKQGGQRLEKKRLKKEGKIKYSELITSTNRAAKKLLDNLDWILNKKDNIDKFKNFDDLNYEKIKILFTRLEIFKATYKKNFDQNYDIPTDDDV